MQQDFLASVNIYVSLDAMKSCQKQYVWLASWEKKRFATAADFCHDKELNGPMRVYRFETRDPVWKGDYGEVIGCGEVRFLPHWAPERVRLILPYQWDGTQWRFGFFRVLAQVDGPPEECNFE